MNTKQIESIINALIDPELESADFERAHEIIAVIRNALEASERYMRKMDELASPKPSQPDTDK